MTEEAVIIHDSRIVFPEADAPAPIQEGAIVPPIDEPPATTAVAPEPDHPEKPVTPSSLVIPSLIKGQEIRFTQGELVPWKGVFFMVAECNAAPLPHMILVPMKHTAGHAKRAAGKKGPAILRAL